MLHPCPTLLFDIAVADAYGAAFEGLTPNRYLQHFQRNDLANYTQHPRFENHSPGVYTDDTQMSIAVAEALLDERSPSDDLFIWWFIEVFRRDPRPGYSQGFNHRLQAITTDARGERLPDTTGQQVRAFKRLVARFSARNGAAMRAVPIGVISDPAKVKLIADVQASPTHNSPRGSWAALAVAMMAHFAFHEGRPLTELGLFLSKHGLRGATFDQAFTGFTDSRLITDETVHAVYSLLTTTANRLELLRQAIAFGGDTDTVAAIAFGIASIRDQTPLPQALLDGLENGPYGRQYLLNLGQRLMERWA